MEFSETAFGVDFLPFAESLFNGLARMEATAGRKQLGDRMSKKSHVTLYVTCLPLINMSSLDFNGKNWYVFNMITAPALESMAGTASNMQFDGAFVGTSKRRGPPSDEIDEQWESIIEREPYYLLFS